MIIKAKVKLYGLEEEYIERYIEILSSNVIGYGMIDENTIIVILNGLEYYLEYNLTLLNNIKQALNENDCKNKINLN